MEVHRLGTTPSKNLPVPAHKWHCHNPRKPPRVLSVVVDTSTGCVAMYRCTRCVETTYSLADGRDRRVGDSGSFLDPSWRNVAEIDGAERGQPVARIPRKPEPMPGHPRSYGSREAA